MYIYIPLLSLSLPPSLPPCLPPSLPASLPPSYFLCFPFTDSIVQCTTKASVMGSYHWWNEYFWWKVKRKHIHDL